MDKESLEDGTKRSVIIVVPCTRVHRGHGEAQTCREWEEETLDAEQKRGLACFYQIPLRLSVSPAPSHGLRRPGPGVNMSTISSRARTPGGITDSVYSSRQRRLQHRFDTSDQARHPSAFALHSPPCPTLALPQGRSFRTRRFIIHAIDSNTNCAISEQKSFAIHPPRTGSIGDQDHA